MQAENKNPAAAAADRNQVIIKTSVIGILTNILLAAFKAAVGILSHSIAVTLDAVNNLSDALSSIITIIGTKLASRLPDRKHPLGHGRIEYLSAMIVSGIVLYAGITALVESVKKIITPEKANYTPVSLLIIAVAIAVKLVLGRYVKGQGERVNSGSLIASGSDATFDAILSASVLGSAIIYLASGVSLEAYVGVIIAIFIIKSGIEMMRETLSEILGERADSELTKKIKSLLTEVPEVRVLNQWTYHSRLYSAAEYVATCGDPGINLVQLVLDICRELLQFLRSIFLGIFAAPVCQVIPHVIGFPQMIAFDNPQVHRVADGLVPVILVAEGGSIDLIMRQGGADVQVDIPLWLTNARHDADQVLA